MRLWTAAALLGWGVAACEDQPATRPIDAGRAADARPADAAPPVGDAVAPPRDAAAGRADALPASPDAEASRPDAGRDAGAADAASDGGAPVADAAEPDAAHRADARPPGPWVELGTGPVAFEPLAPGQRLALVQGPQGGYHFWGALRGDGFDGSTVDLAFFARRTSDDQVVAQAVYTDFLERGADGRYEYAGVTVILLPEIPPVSLDGERVRLELTLTDAGGRILRDRIEVRAVCCER